MNVVVFVLILALLAIVVAIVSAPLRRRPAVPEHDEQVPQAPLAADLAAAREAKYQEIRDAELDYRTGKLSREDYEAVDAGLRAEAIEILDRIERAEAEAGRSA
ncbi:MAG TPA: hypothetical protein VFW29_01440 [Solirubrobacteraceae bacterium]|nr:hypothetical protein [Solirubrobacteraceae bacterium]